jgi:phosphoribosylaminoimidazolecarboxamide formyltransferase/IMP cyclohydrolase
MDSLPIRRALISVTHKDGLAELAALLVERQVELVSTGGTLQALSDAGLPVTPVSGVTGFPEILDGRVKTLHPCIHGGILADKDNPAHLATLAEMRIKPFDLVCVNLYDFAAAVAAGQAPGKVVEEIDIGGPCLIRAASKNYHSVLVLPETAAYAAFRTEFTRGAGKVSLAFRRRMAVRAFSLTAAYDAMIADYLGRSPED